MVCVPVKMDLRRVCTSLTTVLWSRRSGLGTQCRRFGGGFGGRRGGFAVR